MAVHWNPWKVMKNYHRLGPSEVCIQNPSMVDSFSKDSPGDSSVQLGLKTIEITEMPSLFFRRVNQGQGSSSDYLEITKWFQRGLVQFSNCLWASWQGFVLGFGNTDIMGRKEVAVVGRGHKMGRARASRGWYCSLPFFLGWWTQRLYCDKALSAHDMCTLHKICSPFSRRYTQMIQEWCDCNWRCQR